MIKRTICFETPAYLSTKNEQLVISYPNNEPPQKTVPIEDIGFVVLEHAQITISNRLLEKLVTNNAAIINCNAQHMPIGLLMPLSGHSEQNERLRAQLNSSIPLRKNLWQQTIQAKINNQAAVLKERNIAIQKIFKLKIQQKIQFSLGMASVNEIDKYNILVATKLSMSRAVKKLNTSPTQLIIDGKINLSLENFPSRGVIKGDQKSYSIAAASIIAKIHRDRYMKFLSYRYPSYNWSSNSGYGTKKHISEIRLKGITKHHRKSFEPIKSLIHSK